MLSWIFLELTTYAWFRRLIWKPIYQFLAKKFGSTTSWQFMNYGYSPKPDEQAISMPESEQIHIYQLMLYHYLAVKTDIEGKDVLEVGSGRGGGSRYIAQYLKPKSMTGMDLASHAVDFSNRTHHSPNLKYIVGNAEKIPLPDGCMDVVINVESCHAYGSVDNFLAEVKRVLRPGGFLVLTDLRGQPGMELLRSQLRRSGMDFMEEDDITENVVEAIEKEDDLKWKRIREGAPKYLHAAIAEFGGAVGSQIHKQLKSKELIYFRFKLRKNTI